VDRRESALRMSVREVRRRGVGVGLNECMKDRS
jgi:hypothetical protein